MNIKLSNRQKEVYDYIKSYVKKYEYSPHVIEIKKHFGYSAHSTVIQHLKALEKKGYIKVAYKQKRGIHLLDGDKPLRNTVLPLRGVVPAGNMVECFEDYEEVKLEHQAVRDIEKTYALQIRGDSMIEEHILDGDLVLIEERDYASNGQIVVASYEGQMTLKKYFHEGRQIRLQPANSAMDPIIIKGEVSILGVMVGLVRKLV